VLHAEYNVEKRGGTTIWISRVCADPAFVDALADADRLLEDAACDVIKDQKKIKVGRLALTIAGEQRSVYIKRYNAFSLRYRLLSAFSQSGALRSLRGAAVLAEIGVPTARPLAAIEMRVCGTLRASFFVSEEIAGGKTANAYWMATLRDFADCEGFKRRRAFLRQLAAMFRLLHAGGVYHNDLKEANIMVVEGGNDVSVKFFLLDLEGVRRYSSLSERRRVKNLIQIYRTLGTHLSRSQRSYFLKSYLGDSFGDRKLKRDLIEVVLRRARRVDIIKARTAQPANSS
jgi:tRNA A-37 threonylcarbamoyl transferase component Bud32